MRRPRRYEFPVGRSGEMDFNDSNRKYIDYLENKIDNLKSHNK